MSIIYTILIGFVVGLVAKFIMPGQQKLDFVWTACLGIGGSIVATYLGDFLGWYKAGEFAGFIASVVGAVLIMFVWGLVVKKK